MGNGDWKVGIGIGPEWEEDRSGDIYITQTLDGSWVEGLTHKIKRSEKITNHGGSSNYQLKSMHIFLSIN